MFHRGQGVNEANFEVVYACSWQGGLTVLQLMGRRLGRKTFRKLELGRGFCSTDQVFRMMRGKDVNLLDAEDVRLRSKGSIKLYEEDLAVAGSQHMNGMLPDLDQQIDLYRSLQLTSTLIEFTYCLLAISIVISMLIFGHQFALPTIALMMSNLIILYNHSKQKKRINFESWAKLWPKNLLIPGLFESAVTKFVQRKNLNSSLFVIFTCILMAFFNTGAPFHLIMFALSMVVLWKDMSVPLISTYLLGLGIELNAFNLLMTSWGVELNLPPQLMLFDVPISPESLHLLPYGIVALKSLSDKNPQYTWPLMYLTSYTVSYISILWILLSTICVLRLSFCSQIYRLKAILATVIMLLFLGLVLTDFNLAKGQRPKTTSSTDLLWNDFHDLCAEDPWTMRLEQQLQCSRLLGQYVIWEGRVSALQIKPWFGLAWLHQFGLMQCQMKIHMFTGSGLLRKIKTISAFMTNANLCFNVQIGSQMAFEGYLASFGETTTEIFIQSLTNVP